MTEHVAGLGGIAFIGNPQQPTFTVCQLLGEDDERHIYRLGKPITSRVFPNLRLTLDNVA